MQGIKFIAAVIMAFGLASCGKSGDSTANGVANIGEKIAPVAKMLDFVATQDGKPLTISSTLFNTPATRDFMVTGKNLYIGKQDAIEQGKKLFQLYSCTQCHGGDAQGQTGPSLHGPDFHYPKNATNKGMFETIWHGTNNGMGAKGVGLMDPTDPSNGLTPDDVLKIEAWIRTHSNFTGNE